MKKLLILITAIFLLGSCITMPHKIEVRQVASKGYSYEGMVDPHVIQTIWGTLKIVTYGYGTYRGQQGYLIEAFYKNPNGEDEPRVASLLVFYVDNRFPMIIAYTYLYSEDVYVFVLDENNCYKHEEREESRMKLIKQNLLDALDGAET